jgi:spore germination protein
MTEPRREEHGQVTPYQFTAIAVGSMVGLGALAFPRFLVEEAGTAAPLATLLGALVPALAWLAQVKVARHWPDRTPVEYSPQLITRPISWALSSIVIIYVIVLTGLTAREFGSVVKTSVLPNTPIEVSIILLLLATVYFVRYDLQVFARVYEIFLPLMVVPLTLIGLLSLKNARFYYLLPFLGTSWRGLFKGAALASVGYIALVIGPFLLPSLTKPKEAARSGLIGIGLTCFVYMLTINACLAVFGPEETKHMIWPTFELIKTTTVPGFILERIESAFIGIWVVAVFTTAASTYYTALVATAQLFRLGDHKTLAIPLLPIIFMIAMAPANIHSFYGTVARLGLYGVLLTNGGSFVYLVISALRKRRAQPGATQA